MPKNIILISIDCLREDHLRYMQKLMKRRPKAVFTNFFANGTFTGFSIPSLFTGKYPPILSKETTLAEVLKNAGFNTLGFHTNAVIESNIGSEFNIRKGFDIYKYFPGDHEKDISWIQNYITRVIRNRFPIKVKKLSAKAFELLKVVPFPFQPYLYYLEAEDVLKEAENWLDKAKTPFFLWVHLNDCHDPPYVPEGYRSIDERLLKILNFQNFILSKWQGEFVISDINAYHQVYIDSVKYVDDMLNDFLSRILDEETIVLITADHGEQFMEHGGINHLPWVMYEEQMHIPLVILNYMNKEENKLASLQSLPKTICEMVDIKNNFLGKNLFDNYREEPIYFVGHSSKYEEITYERTQGFTRGFLFGIRTKEWKLIQSLKGWELYNLKDDSKEKNNLYYTEKEKAFELKRMLDSRVNILMNTIIEKRKIRNLKSIKKQT